ncbi:MAG TPA: hypothetical protein VIJ39_06400 [Solirubrobacteraceae bacterium]
MLFDTRARGRRRTVQVVYVGLAFLFLVGFVGFGVGVGGGGGSSPIEALFGNKEGSNGAGFAAQVSSAEKRVHKNPGEAAGWAALTVALVHESGAGENFEESTGKFTSKGKVLLAKAATAWSRYVALHPAKPNVTAGEEMLTVFGQEGLNQPSSAVEALQLIIPERPPTAALYGELALYAYQAKNASLGDLAAKKTISLTPAAKRKTVEGELERIKKNPTGNPSNETFTGTTNGKVYTVKVGEKGAGTILKTSPAPTKTKAPATTTK